MDRQEAIKILEEFAETLLAEKVWVSIEAGLINVGKAIDVLIGDSAEGNESDEDILKLPWHILNGVIFDKNNNSIDSITTIVNYEQRKFAVAAANACADIPVDILENKKFFCPAVRGDKDYNRVFLLENK